MRARLPALAVGVLVLAWYLFTLAPSLVWGDGGRLQVDGVAGASLYWQFDELAGVRTDGWAFDRLGVAAWDHPLWVMLGHGLVSLGLADPAWLLNLLSAVPAAATVGVFAMIIHELTREWWGAVVGSVALAVSHVYWFHAVTAEVYALHALFMAVLIWMAVRGPAVETKRLAGFAFVAGLGLSNHVMLGLTAVPVAVFLAVRAHRGAVDERPHLGWSGSAWALAAFLLGWTPWWLQFVRMAHVAGFRTTAHLAAGFPWLGDRWPGPIGPNLLVNAGEYVAVAAYQFTPIGLAAGAYGAIRLWRRHRPEATLLLTLFGLHAVFSANYAVADRFAFHLPSFAIYAVFIGYGASEALARLPWSSGTRHRVVAMLTVCAAAAPIALYAAVPGILRRHGVTDEDVGIPTVGVGGRDGIEYFLDPNQRGDDSARRFGSEALDALAPGALVLVAWPHDLEAYLAMRYVQAAAGRRADVEFDLMLFTGLPVRASVLAIAQAQAGCRPVYLASDNPATYPIDELRRDFTITPEAFVFRLRPRQDAGRTCRPTTAAPATLDDLVRSVRR